MIIPLWSALVGHLEDSSSFAPQDKRGSEECQSAQQRPSGQLGAAVLPTQGDAGAERLSSVETRGFWGWIWQQLLVTEEAVKILRERRG